MRILAERCDVEEANVARDQQLVLRQEHHEITIGVRREHRHDAHFGLRDVKRDVAVEGLRRREDCPRLGPVSPSLALRPQRRPRHLLDHLVAAVRVRNDHRVVRDELVAADVIAVMV